MPNFTADRPGMKIIGVAVQPLIDGLGSFAPMARRILAEKGIPELKADEWYSLDVVLDALRVAAATFGPATLYQIGLKTVDNVPLPPQVKTIEQLVQLYNSVYAQIIQGNMIKNRFELVESGPGYAKIVSRTSWHCDIDRGSIFGTVRQLHSFVKVEHDNTAPCRAKGADSCTYIVRWQV